MERLDTTYKFRLPSELKEKAMAKAGREDVTLPQVLRRCLRRWVESSAPLEPTEWEKKSRE